MSFVLRRVRSQWLLFGVLALGATPVLPGSAAATTSFVVKNVADLPDAKPGDGVCAAAGKTCSLRAAIDEANAQQSPVHIELRPGRYELDSPLKATAPIALQGTQPAETIVAASATFQGERLLALDGAGAPGWREINDITLDGNGRTGVVETLRSVPLRITRVVIRGGVAREGGAGIAANGPLILRQSSLVGNRIEAGGGRGGALLVEEAPAWVTQTTFTGNHGRNSGGVFARNAQVVIDYSSLVGNTGSPVGEYQQNPKSALHIRGSWLGESRVASGARRLDCRSTSQEGEGIVSGGDNLLAVTGPTSDKLINGVWQSSYEFFCNLTGQNDRMGSLAKPLEGAWRVVTGPTGLIGVEADTHHPASRMVRPDRCPAEDAWGRSIPQGQNCDAGALYAAAWTGSAVTAPQAAPPAPVPSPQAPQEPASPEDGTPPVWIWIAGFGLAVLIAAVLLRRRGPGRGPKK